MVCGIQFEIIETIHHQRRDPALACPASPPIATQIQLNTTIPRDQRHDTPAIVASESGAQQG
jgi:hypothetical protein